MKKRLKFKLHYQLLMQFFLALLFFIISSQVLKAQIISISGVVTDQSSGDVLPGANVLIKGTTTGTVTDVEGRYTVDIESQDAVLVYSYIGFQTTEVRVGNQTVINVGLEFLAEDIEEIVVVGYGVQKKKLSTGATVNVKAEDIENKHTLRIEQAIQGISPGVSITANSGQPGEPLKVRIRGVGTVGDSDPLYVVDGMPTDDIRYLNPSDIESVDILKDAASAAIYGARAANGVILITTKQGETGQMRVSYDAYYGIQNTPKKFDMLNGQEYCMVMNEAAINSEEDSIVTQAQIESIGEGTNWIDYLFKENVPTQNHVLSLTGGTDRSVYSASLSYLKQEGIIGSENKSEFERLSFRFNSEHKLYKDRVKFGENLVYSHSNVRGVGVGDAYDNAVRSFVNASPTFPVYSDTTENGFGRSFVQPLEVNPVGMMHYSDFIIDKYDKLLGNIFAEIEFVKGLSFTSKFGIDLSFKRTNEYLPVYRLNEVELNTNSTAKMSIESQFTYNFENYLTYARTFGRNSFMFLIGNTIQEYNKFEVSGEKEDLIIEDFDFAILDDWNKDRGIKFTVQDPCQLVRKSLGDPIAEDLRFVVKTIVGEENFIDMTPNRSNNFCCGGGGGFLQSGLPEARRYYGRRKFEQITETNASYCITPCHNCHSQIHDLKEHFNGSYHTLHLWTIMCLAMGILGENERAYLGPDLVDVNPYPNPDIS